MYNTLDYLEANCLDLLEAEYGIIDDVNVHSLGGGGFRINVDLADMPKQVYLEFVLKVEPRAYLCEFSYDHGNEPKPDYIVKCEKDITEDVQKLLVDKYAMLALLARQELLGE